MMLNSFPSCAVYFCLFAMVCSGAVAVVQDLAPESAPDLLTFDELLQLSETAEPEGALAERLHRLLYTPPLDR
jgi:plasmid replication initiation protein